MVKWYTCSAELSELTLPLSDSPGKAMVETAQPPIITPRLIGRASQLASLLLLVEGAKLGEGRIALIHGEAGIGKSRLVAEVKTAALAQSFLLLQGNCFPRDVSYPYAPLLDLLRSFFASQSATPLTGELKRLARDLFPLLPELVPDLMTPPMPLEPEQEKRRLFAVLSNFFTRLSATSPLLLVIEDVHWSDSTSLDFLHMLARRAASHPLLLLVTYRHDEMRAELRSWLAELDRERLAQEINLASFTRMDVDAMLSAIFEERHTSVDMRRFLHGELLDTIQALTEGNPFFIEEMLGSLVSQGDLYYVQGYWNRRSLDMKRIPRSVQEAVQRRTERLGERARYTLTLAAVAGRRFDFTLLQQLTRYDESQLLETMKELVAAQLVVEESDERFAFRHALTRRAIYLQLLTRERVALHRTIAETLEQLTAFAPDAHLEDLATHFYQARAWQKAQDYALRAGEKAVLLYAHRAAINYFSWALESTEHQSHPPAPAVYRARGQAYEVLGEFEQAQVDYTRALEAARSVNDGVAEWQSAIDLGFLWAGRDYSQAESWFRQALKLSQSLDDPALHAHSLNRIGNWHLNVEQPHEALRYHQEALTIFRQLHNSPGIAETLDLSGMASYLSGDLFGGTSYYRQAITLFDELGNRAGLTSSLATIIMSASTYHTDSLAAASTLAEALPEVERAIKIAREIGQRSAESYALWQLGVALGSQGAYTRALAVCQEGLTIAEEIEHRQWQSGAHAMLGGVFSGLLAVQQARDHFEQALTLAQETHSQFWIRMSTGYLAALYVLQHDYARAEALLSTALRPDTPMQTLGERMMWCSAVELALAQGYAEEALNIVEQLIASTPQTSEGKIGLRIMKLRGEALVALQRLSEAEKVLTMAQALALSQGARPVQWRVSIALGNLYQAQGRKTEAEQAFAMARALIEELAATVVDELLRENFLRQATALLPRSIQVSPGRSAKQTPGGLTEREREVAILIAQGESNQAIADALIVSKRTVETHISNIMFKLGCTSRTQIAVWAVEVGLAKMAETESSKKTSS